MILSDQLWLVFSFLVDFSSAQQFFVFLFFFGPLFCLVERPGDVGAPFNINGNSKRSPSVLFNFQIRNTFFNLDAKLLLPTPVRSSSFATSEIKENCVCVCVRVLCGGYEANGYFLSSV